MPWCFKTQNGKIWQLDKGCVGHAFANGVLVVPKKPEVTLWHVELANKPGIQADFESGGSDEVERLKRWAKIASRPHQQEFRDTTRNNYADRCAVTGCATPAVLDAAHIRLVGRESGRVRSDENQEINGILLRTDIHALFDSYLVTFSADGKHLEVSPRLTDPQYQFLQSAPVRGPVRGPGPSLQNIQDHRERFLRETGLCAAKWA